MTVHLIPLIPHRRNVPAGTELTDHVSTWTVDDMRVDPDVWEFVGPNGTRYGLGICGPTTIHNLAGERVQRAHAYLYGLATVIAAAPSQRPQPTHLRIEFGDVLVGLLADYVLRVDPPAYRLDAPRLTILHAPAALADRSEHLAAIRERDALRAV